MPVARRRKQRTFTRSARPGTTWSRVVSSVSIVIPAASKVLVAMLTLDNVGITETVRRTRGRVIAFNDVVGDEEQFGAFGFIVVNDLALAAGAASIPGPVTDASDDGWYVWEPIITKSSSGSGTTNTVNDVIVFDSKAMRRVEEGYSVAVMFENAHATFGMEVAIGLSSLASRS